MCDYKKDYEKDYIETMEMVDEIEKSVKNMFIGCKKEDVEHILKLLTSTNELRKSIEIFFNDDY